MSKILKLTFINIIVFLVFVIFSDLIFGYWFKDYNFGPQLRGKRIQKIVFNHNNEKTIYLRDFYGFRTGGNIYEKYDPSKIKIIFNGGSTGDEMNLNYDDTIVGKLNTYFNEDQTNLKIYNASLSGKSLNGHIEEFRSWFKDIPNFNPDIMIYYFGINDRGIKLNRWHDFKYNLNFFNKIHWNITQKSFFYEKLKYVKDNYFFSQRDKYFTNNKDLIKKLKNNEFVSYEYAKSKYKLDSAEEKKIVNNF